MGDAGRGVGIGGGPGTRLPVEVPPGPPSWRLRTRTLSLEEPVVMGILNVTPDSFSDGGELADAADALARGRAMVEAGARILDVGGESTRPGAATVPEDEELRRVVPVVEALVGALDVPVSVDTRKAAVARGAVEAGAEIVNDVSGLAFDPGMGDAVAATGSGVVLMHMRGGPGDMQERTAYEDLVGEVATELGEALERARRAGVDDDRIVVDPGVGFAKTAEQNVRLLGRLGRLNGLGRPLLVGPSRKSFLGTLLGVPPAERGAGTAAACVLAYLQGARIFRVHDVRPVAHALRIAHAVATAGAAEPGPAAARHLPSSVTS